MPETSSLSFSQQTDRLRQLVDEALQCQVEPAPGCPDGLREAMAYSLLAPGKRFRPMLVLMAVEACGGRIEAAMPAACAVEMVHAYSLIHDDLPAMDDDDLRRGRPTCHKKFDEATAILAGDALLTRAFEVLADQLKPGELAARCCAALAAAAGPCGMVGGQADDMTDPTGDADIEGLESIHLRKTGALIEVSLKLGAMIAGAEARQLDALARYGRKLGLAFQVTDDLLDVCSSQVAMGKQVRKDAQQGKLTYPGVLGVDETAAYARQLVDEACEALMPLGTKAGSLEVFARYVLERNR